MSDHKGDVFSMHVSPPNSHYYAGIKLECLHVYCVEMGHKRYDLLKYRFGLY